MSHQSRAPGKNVRPSAIQNCPRTVDCAAVEVRGQFWMARGRTFLPGARDWCDILTLYPSKSNLYLIKLYKPDSDYGQALRENLFI